MNILDQLAAHAKERVALAKQKIDEKSLALLAMQQKKGDFAFEKALACTGMSFICECKKASPSKGVIAENYPYLQIAKAYEEAGADCISVLTEPKWFLGSDEHLQTIAQQVTIPCIRKDFVVDEYMLYEAKVLGASAALLICAILSTQQIKDYIQICDSLGLSALVEAHDEAEIDKALQANARIIGVNNRNLKDFSVNTNNSASLKAKVPKGILFVSESGISSHDEIKALSALGVDAVLIGETLMRSNDKKAKLAQLRGLYD